MENTARERGVPYILLKALLSIFSFLLDKKPASAPSSFELHRIVETRSPLIGLTSIVVSIFTVALYSYYRRLD